MKPDLVDTIYEAAVFGELWPSVLEQIRRDTQSAIGLLIARDRNSQVNSITNPGMEHIPEEYAKLNLFARSRRMERALSRSGLGFTSDDEFFTDEEKQQDPGYTEFLFPRGWGNGTATTIQFPDTSAIFVNFERTRVVGAFEPQTLDYLNLLRPHFGRASALMHKAELSRARDRVEALSALGIAAMALDTQGRALAFNMGMQAFLPSVLADRQARVTFTDKAADRLWQEVVNAGCRQSLSIPVKCEPQPVVVHLLPVVRGARDLFAATASILIIMPVVSSAGSLPANVIQILFDLTPSEARVAYALADGSSVTDIALRQSLSRETVRSHVKNVMRKTGTSRQVELVRLLSSGAIAKPDGR